MTFDIHTGLPIPRFLMGCFAEGEGGDGGGSGEGEGNEGGDGGSAGAEGGGEPWYQSIESQDVRELAAKFESRDKLLEGIGYKPPDWRDTIEDTKLRDHAGKFTSITDLVKGNLTQRQQLSTAITVPGKDAKPEEVAEFHKRLGALGSPEEYLSLFPQPEEGQEWGEAEKAQNEAWAKRFHDMGVSKGTAEALINSFNEDMAKAGEAVKAEDDRFAEESKLALQREWGGDFAANVKYADDAAKQLFGGDFEDMRQLKMGNDRFLLDDPRMIRALAKVGREMQEGRPASLTDDARASVQDEISGLRKQIEEAQANHDDKRANELYQKVLALQAKLSGAQPIVGSQGRAA